MKLYDTSTTGSQTSEKTTEEYDENQTRKPGKKIHESIQLHFNRTRAVPESLVSKLYRALGEK